MVVGEGSEILTNDEIETAPAFISYLRVFRGTFESVWLE